MPQEVNLNLWEKVQNIVLHQAGYYGLGDSGHDDAANNACGRCAYGTAAMTRRAACPEA